MTTMQRILLSLILSFVGGVGATAQTQSALWGENGERWSPESRLPDFSFAGFGRGEMEIPSPPVTHNVRDFGAVGDGEHDDSDAFVRALEAIPEGVLFVPAGRYLLKKKLAITKPNVVVRGEGPDTTVLYCPTPLNDIEPNWGATTGGQRTSNYSWSGGFISIQGRFQRPAKSAITMPAKRGRRSIQVEDSSPFEIGQEVEVRQEDDGENSLANHLYSGDPRIGLEKLRSRTRATLVARVTDVRDNVVTLDRALRFDIESRWKPTLSVFESPVTRSGIEGIGFEFPNTPYKGHFSELGYNAFTLSQVTHCWVRNVRIHNSDSGGFISGMFNTVEDIVFTSERSPDSNRDSTGHHGITCGGDDNLVRRFDFQTKFIHDLTVTRSGGNVIANGRAVDISLDHHRHGPYENLFTNIDAGLGTRVWMCGGGADLGAHCAGRGTFWNIHAANPIKVPESKFGPWSMNFVGVSMGIPDQTDPKQRWYEHSSAANVEPLNLHEAQLERRIGSQH